MSGNGNGGYTGPDPGMLKNLAGMLPGMAKHVVKEHKKKHAKKILVPDSFEQAEALRNKDVCLICGGLFTHILAPGEDVNVKPAFCKDCQTLLDHDWIAFVCGEKFAFGLHPSLSDMSGTVVTVHPDVMKALEEKGMEIKTKQQNPEQPE